MREKMLVKISMILIFLGVATMCFIQFKYTIVLDKPSDYYLFAFAVATFFASIVVGLDSLRISNVLYRKSIHQAIGGYIPSIKLNELVRRNYMMRHHIYKLPKTNFVDKWNNAEKLLEGLESYTFEENPYRQIVVCRIKVRYGKEYEAKSASKEMALCIAFLKSCGLEEEVDSNKD